MAVGILHEIYFAIFAICNFYLSRNIPQVLKGGSIAAAILIVLSQITVVAVWISEYKCNSFLYFTFGPVFTMLYASCYVLLFTMFAIKVHASTKDSIYGLSKCFVSCLFVLSLTFILCVILLILFYSFNNTTLGYLFVLLAMIVNWILYISLLVKLIKALYYVLKTTLILSVSHDHDPSTCTSDLTGHVNDINNSRLLLFGLLFVKADTDMKQTTVTGNNFQIDKNNKNNKNNKNKQNTTVTCCTYW